MSKILKSGFTIVELTLVVVVIAIIATISAVNYASVSQSTRDSQRQTAVDTIADGLKVFYAQNKPDTSCGTTNAIYGNSAQPGYGYYMTSFFSLDPDGVGSAESIEQCLISGDYIDNAIADPTETVSCSTGSLDCFAYMVATCLTEGTYETYVYANLETVDHTASDTDNTCQIAAQYDTNYGMNYVKKVE